MPLNAACQQWDTINRLPRKETSNFEQAMAACKNDYAISIFFAPRYPDDNERLRDQVEAAGVGALRIALVRMGDQFVPWQYNDFDGAQ
jgi:hypothetical protein